MNIEKILNTKDFKLTNARKTILELLIKAEKALCYEDLKDILHMDKATFYRNILRFEEEEIVNSFESNDKKRYYEISKKKHPHFICTVCSKIECIHQELKLNLDGYQINNVILKGICKACLNTK